MQRPRHIRKALTDKVNAVTTANLGSKPEPVITARVNGRNVSLGYRMSPRPTVSHKFSIHPGRGAGAHSSKLTSLSAAVSQSKAISTSVISHADKSLTKKQKASKYRLPDSELYDQDKLDALGYR